MVFRQRSSRLVQAINQLTLIFTIFCCLLFVLGDDTSKYILILSYEAFGRNETALAYSAYDLLICDEAHRLKKQETVVYQQIQRFSPARRILVTATPFHNDLSDLFSLLHLVSKRRFANEEAFSTEFQEPIKKCLLTEASEAEKQEGRKKVEDLKSQYNDYFIRRTTEEVEKVINQAINEFIIWCDLTKLQKEDYIKLAGDATKNISSSSVGYKELAALFKICNSAQPGDGKQPLDLAASSKLTLVDVLLRDINERNAQKKILNGEMDKVVLVSNLLEMLDYCEQLCKQNNYLFLRLDGNTNDDDRKDFVEECNDHESEVFIFMISSLAGGEGINLSGANHLIMLDCHWNPQKDIQAMARITRPPQKKECYIYR